MENREFNNEWCLLQNQFDSYEKHSLYIKLLSIVVFLAAEISGVASIPIFLVLVVLWFQDAIWKTFQSRIESRLMQVERNISEKSDANAFQFNSDYKKARVGGSSLIDEYFRQSIRPTVAFPHVVLVIAVLLQSIF